MTRTLSPDDLKKSSFFNNWCKKAYSLPIKDIAHRYSELTEGLDGNINFFSSPGRAELVGNHTDHNNGLVLAATIDLDTIAAVIKTPMSKEIVINSKGFPKVIVDIQDLSVKADEYGKSPAMVRGVLKGFQERGYKTGGFIANTSSNIFKGAGVSSSAAFELLICEILDVLYNQGDIDFITKATISQFAENHYFGKPSGLMDQLTIASGGVNYMDFQNDIPKIQKMEWPFENMEAVIINCGGDHSDLTHEYAQIKEDMSNIAKALSADNLRQTTQEDFYQNIKELKKDWGGKAVLRAKHFYEENIRVNDALMAIKNKEEKAFIDIINKSGTSSYEQLQNCFISGDKEQNIPYALKMAMRYKKVKAARVHGGGFAGTILVLIEKKEEQDFVAYMKNFFGRENVFALNIRASGATKVEV
ncbi:MAG: galactokinase [Bacillota bacterium]